MSEETTMQPCPTCGKEISTNAETCPNCGEPIKKKAQEKKTAFGCGGSLAIILLCIGIYALFSPATYKKDHVTQEEYGATWPFTIPEGDLQCDPPQRVTITYQGSTYAVNGSARNGSHYLSLDDIWKDSPDYPGAKITFPTSIIQRGLKLCKK